MSNSEPVTTSPSASVTDVRLQPAERGLLIGGGLIVGAVVGVLVARFGGWAAGLEWAPAQDLLRLIARLVSAHGWLRIALPVVGAVVGVIGGLWLCGQATWVRITDREIEVTAEGKLTRYARSQVGLVTVDGKHLVVRDTADADLGRHSLDVDRSRVAHALVRHDWPSVPR